MRTLIILIMFILIGCSGSGDSGGSGTKAPASPSAPDLSSYLDDCTPAVFIARGGTTYGNSGLVVCIYAGPSANSNATAAAPADLVATGDRWIGYGRRTADTIAGRDDYDKWTITESGGSLRVVIQLGGITEGESIETFSAYGDNVVMEVPPVFGAG